MKEIEVIQQIKVGDSTAFEKWMEIYSKNIGCLAIQYGCTPEQAEEVTEQTFRTLHSNLKNLLVEERLVDCLYKIVIEKLTHVKLTKSPHKNIFRFEEDQQLHEKIILLEEKEKVSFILSQFHGMNVTKISTLLDMPEDAIQQAISKAYRHLEERVTKLEKRLEFLGKSYNRLVFSFNKENVFQYQQEKNEEPMKQKPTLSKRVLFTWAAGIVTLIALIIVSIVSGEEFQISSDEKYVEKLKLAFENEVTNKFTEVGLIEENDFLGDFYQNPFAQLAREEFEALMEELKRQIKNNKKVNRKEIKQQYDDLVRSLELPSEMVDRLFKNPLTDNKEKSEEFVGEYLEKIQTLQHSYFVIFFNHSEIIEGAIIDGKIDIEKFLEEKDSYPDDLQNMLKGMISQNFYPTSIPEWAPFYPKHANNEISNRIRDSLHEDVGGYITLLESEPLYFSPDTALAIEESVDYMNEMEVTLLASESHTFAYNWLMDTYVNLLNGIIIGSEPNQIFDREGKVKEEYRIGWKKIASLGEKSPSAFLMGKIIDEMEASEWTVSETHLFLDIHNFYNVVDNAKQGNHDSYALEADIHQGGFTVSPNNPEYQAIVKERYEKFSKTHELQYLQNANPLVILGIYYLANELEDPVTMWHLFNHEHIDISLEDYVKEWMQADRLPIEEGTLSAEMGSNLNGVPHVPIRYEHPNMTTYFAYLIADEAYSYLWRLQTIPLPIETP